VNRREPIRRRLSGLHPQRPRTHPCDTIKQPTPFPGGRRAQHWLKQLTRDPESDLGFELRAARPQHPKATRLRAGSDRRQELALSNPRRTLHHNYRPHAGVHAIKHPIHTRQLDTTLEQAVNRKRG